MEKDIVPLIMKVVNSTAVFVVLDGFEPPVALEGSNCVYVLLISKQKQVKSPE
jgi:hypothetical protein